MHFQMKIMKKEEDFNLSKKLLPIQKHFKEAHENAQLPRWWKKSLVKKQKEGKKIMA